MKATTASALRELASSIKSIISNALIELFVWVFVVFASGAFLIGYVKNIEQLIDHDFNSPYVDEVVLIAGLSPIGGVTGWFDIEENLGSIGADNYLVYCDTYTGCQSIKL